MELCRSNGFFKNFLGYCLGADPDARKLDEGIRFPVCNAANLANAFQKAGLTTIETTNLNIWTIFKNFEDYWDPFLGGQGPAGSYLVSIDKDLQTRIRNNLLSRLPVEADGSIKLLARAIAVRGIRKT